MIISENGCWITKRASLCSSCPRNESLGTPLFCAQIYYYNSLSKLLPNLPEPATQTTDLPFAASRTCPLEPASQSWVFCWFRGKFRSYLVRRWAFRRCRFRWEICLSFWVWWGERGCYWVYRCRSWSFWVNWWWSCRRVWVWPLPFWGFHGVFSFPTVGE